ncbi:MAG: hypothetical protein HY696_03795 [Deltaproteobacteria bacterium]|nr:hypothetical protein [Deltaproteobacteria bacterium]
MRNRWLGFLVMCGVAVGLWPGAAAALSLMPPLAAEQAPANLIDCHRVGQIYDVETGKCQFATSPGAVDLMGPLLGVNGTLVDPDTIEDSMTGEAATATTYGGQDDEKKSKKKKTKAEEDPACNNGVYADGCENGTRRLCSFIPDLPTPTGEWPQFVLGIILLALVATFRRRLPH